MLLHDVADPWMEISKVGLYIDSKIIPYVAFTIFTIVFIFTRNWLFPRFLVYSVWYQMSNNDRVNETEYKYYLPTVISLSTLALLHVFWAVLILKIAIMNLRGESRGDIREE
jgi:hypothetical protein